MPRLGDAFYRLLLPAYGIALVAWILVRRAILLRRGEKDPVVARPGADDSPTCFLEAAQLAAAAAGAFDLVLNAVATPFVATHLAVPFLRESRTVATAGVAVLTVGLALVFVAIHTMGRSWRIGIDKEATANLVTVGVFRFVRHPVYSGMLLATLGFALATSDLLAWAVAGSSWVGLGVQARLEEEFLVARYGAPYRAYCAATGRFWPRRPTP